VFEPLGYDVEAVRGPLDDRFAEWGDSPYFSVTVRKTTTLSDLLTHLCVLIPVFDNRKHYWVGDDEMESKSCFHAHPRFAGSSLDLSGMTVRPDLQFASFCLTCYHSQGTMKT
jgi:hypothetical protein